MEERRLVEGELALAGVADRISVGSDGAVEALEVSANEVGHEAELEHTAPPCPEEGEADQAPGPSGQRRTLFLLRHVSRKI